MKGLFLLLFAAVFFSGSSLACDRLLSSEVVGPIVSISPQCADYDFFLHRESCLNSGGSFESTWHVSIENEEGVCPLEYSVVRTCKGDCGDNLRLLGKMEVECSEGTTLCPFLHQVYDCEASWGWKEEQTCEGGLPFKLRRRVCSDCRGVIVDEDFCGARNESMVMEEKEICQSDPRYHTEWETGECTFTHPNCVPEATSTRKCMDDTWAINRPLCDQENLQVTFPCQLGYDCCNCRNRTECASCDEDYLVGVIFDDEKGETTTTETTTASIETTPEITTKVAVETTKSTTVTKKTETTTEEDAGADGGLDAQSGALGAGAIGGIVVGPLVLLVGIGTALFYLYHKRQVQQLKRKIEDCKSVKSEAISETVI